MIYAYVIYGHICNNSRTSPLFLPLIKNTSLPMLAHWCPPQLSLLQLFNIKLHISPNYPEDSPKLQICVSTLAGPQDTSKFGYPLFFSQWLVEMVLVGSSQKLWSPLGCNCTFQLTAPHTLPRSVTCHPGCLDEGPFKQEVE